MLHKWFLVIVVTVSAAAQSTPPEAPKQFYLSGTVVDSVHGDVLPDIEVSLAISNTDSVLQTIVTGPDGRFDFPGLAPAKYALSARGPGYLPQMYEEHHSFSTGIVTGPDFDTSKLIFRVNPEASISGTVTDEFGDPVPTAEVMLFGGAPEAAQAIVFKDKAFADDAGFFRVFHLREGKYYLAVRAHPWYARNDLDERDEASSETSEDTREERPGRANTASSAVRRHSEFDVAFQTRYYPNATDPELATPIVLKPGERATTNFRLSAVPAVRLKIRGTPSFTRAEGSVVLREQILSTLRQVATQNIGEEGTEFDGLPPGHYQLEIPSPGPRVLPEKRPLDLVSDTEVVPGEGDRSVATVTGTIRVEGADLPCLPCNVRFLKMPSGEQFLVENTAKGFEVKGGVRPGTYDLWAFNREHYLVKEISAVGAKVIGEQIEIQAGTAVKLSIVMTKDSGAIEGVALWQGKPVSQAAVFLIPDDPAHNLSIFWGDQSDSDGTFGMRWILPGEYTLVAISEGWDLELTNPAALAPYLRKGVRIHIRPGNKERVEVAVQPLGGAPK